LTFANVTALLALVLAAAGGAYALSVPDASGVFHGCVSRHTGTLRVVRAASSCHRPRRSHGRVIDPGEYAIAWNQQGPTGPQGPAGTTGPQGTAAQTPAGGGGSQSYSKGESDARYERAGRILYGSANDEGPATPILSVPELGFEIVADGPASKGNIAIAVTNIGTKNINGVAMVHNGPPGNTISGFPFGLSPGETTDPAFSTEGPFVDLSIVTSGADPEHAADARCMNVTSAGMTRAHCWVIRSEPPA
jgi:hypothetical protein